MYYISNMKSVYFATQNEKKKQMLKKKKEEEIGNKILTKIFKYKSFYKISEDKIF